MTILNAVITRVRNFSAARGGNVAIIFALTSLPLLAFTGAAIDYGLATRLEVKLQAATDATALALCKTDLSTTPVALQAQAQTTMLGYMGTAARLVVDPLTITSNPRKILLSTHGGVNAFFSNFIGTPHLDTSVTAQCATPNPKTFEIALVLDNTASMNETSGSTSKIQALRTAASNFVSYVFSNPAFASGTRMSVVPFASSVKLDPNLYATATWADTKGMSAYHWTDIDKTQANTAGFTSRFSIYTALKAVKSSWAWAGCFESLPYPLNTQDGAPTSNNDTLYVPMLAPDEPGDANKSTATIGGTTYNVSNSYLDDSDGTAACAVPGTYMDAEKQACKYLHPTNPNGTGPNQHCTGKPLQRLTTDSTTLKNLISTLSASDNTNIHEGLEWGWRTLSPLSVFADGVAYTSTTTSKVLVLMTDGYNAWSTVNDPNKSQYFPYSFVANADGSGAWTHFPASYKTATSASQLRSAMDQLTAETCSNTKAAGVFVYTIGFSVPSDPIDKAGINLLQSCASASNMFYIANNSDDLISAFDQIAKSIGSLRLTQ